MLGVLLVLLAPQLPGECPPAALNDPLRTLMSDVELVSQPILPSCSSDLFKGIFEAAKGFVREGTVKGGLVATGSNAAGKEVLIRGPKIFRAMGDLIESAEVEANVQTWNWHPGSAVSKEITTALGRLERRRRLAGAKRPVTVRLLINYAPIASRDMMTGLSAEIERLGIDPTLVTVELAGHHHSLLGANHTKDLTVDGRKAIVLGPNVSSDNDTETDYFDAGYRFEGEVASGLREDFADVWSQSWQWTCGTQSVNRTVKQPGNREDTAPQSCWQPPARLEPLPIVPVAGCTPMLIATRPANGVPWKWGSDHENPQAQAFFGALAFAKTRIRMQTPNLNEPTVQRALVEAARQGIKVEIVLSKKYEEFTESMPTRGGTNDDGVKKLYEMARESGVKKPCERLQVRWFSNDGSTPVEENGPPTSHAKYLSVDGQVVIVGSANMDIQSWRNSREVNVVVDSQETTHAWDAQVFEPSFDHGVPAACP